MKQVLQKAGRGQARGGERWSATTAAHFAQGRWFTSATATRMGCLPDMMGSAERARGRNNRVTNSSSRA